MPRDVAVFVRAIADDTQLDAGTRKAARSLLDRFGPPQHLMGARVHVDAGRPGPQCIGEVFRINYKHGTGWLYDVVTDHERRNGRNIATVIEAVPEARLTAVRAAPKPGPHLAAVGR